MNQYPRVITYLASHHAITSTRLQVSDTKTGINRPHTARYHPTHHTRTEGNTATAPTRAPHLQGHPMELICDGLDQLVKYWPALAAAMGLCASGWSHRSECPASCHMLFFLILACLGMEVLCNVSSGSCDWSQGGLWLGITIVGGVMAPNGNSARTMEPSLERPLELLVSQKTHAQQPERITS
ncbi:MAG: hypothetical protein O2931_14175 [Planctomycetota bacterium]|nr:hypothetical protein [Planctomycetota bacterium]MDA1179932.1 hypothetical protein [Planctomycetota bacterium]